MAGIPLASASPSCRAALELLPDFEKLRAAAGFEPDKLALWIDSSVQVNASYTPEKILLTTAFLKDASRGRDARVMAIAHEIGHAVQDRQGLIAWRNEPAFAFARRVADERPRPELIGSGSEEEKEFLVRSRRLEAQADTNGQELMVRAGYQITSFTEGTADYFGCQNPMMSSESSHPAGAQRFVNSVVTGGAIANERARAALRRQADEFGTASAADVSVPVQPYVPRTNIDDFNDQGQLLPGRLATARRGVPSPSEESGAVARRPSIISNLVNHLVVEPFAAAVDEYATQNSFAIRVFAACGTPEVAEMTRHFGVWDWIKAISADAARRRALAGPGASSEE